MVRIAAILIISGAVLASTAWAGAFGFGMGLAYYRPPEEGASYTTLYTGSAYYWVNKHVVPSLEVGYSRYKVGETRYNYVPVIPRVAYHFALTKMFDPYAGLGLVYAHKWWSGENEGVDDLWGFAGLAGINVAATEKFVIGLGVEYVVPDASDFDSAYPAFRVGLGAVGL